jgi:hypothetical protein
MFEGKATFRLHGKTQKASTKNSSWMAGVTPPPPVIGMTLPGVSHFQK